jgi:hypothetical protein
MGRVIGLGTVVTIELIIEPESWRARWYRRFFGVRARRAVCCAMVAIYVNLLVVVLLGLLRLRLDQLRSDQVDASLTLTWLPEEPEPDPEPVELSVVQQETPDGLPLNPEIVPLPSLVEEAPEIPSPLPGQAAPPEIVPPEGSGFEHTPQVPLVATDLKVGGGYEGRTAKARAQLVSARGGSPASERAVERGLAWLAAHQWADGGWRFNHREGPCAGRCSHHGTNHSTTAATGLALLAYLGAGDTHRDGDHQEVVAKGLSYLRSRIVPSSRGADLQEGTMYGQGIATLALCEAYALTNDPDLRGPAQQALDFIASVQHPLGGWRYFPGQPGDTTVLGWQLMALQSGRLAGLQTSQHTFDRAQEFLDRVQSDQGAAYGYQIGGDQPTPSAVGLLCRMYHGWPRSDARLQLGVERLAARGPDEHDLYFTYYATQVLHHFDGPQWETWNGHLRDRLVANQATEGHEAGSWYTADYHTTTGGRLCDTALAIMILEVYYRHLPLYGFRGLETLW